MAFASGASVAVFVDGAPTAYVSQSATGAPACDMAGSAWPTSFYVPHSWLGSGGAADAGVWALLDATFYARALSLAEASAAWGATSAPVAASAPPPPYAAP